MATKLNNPAGQVVNLPVSAGDELAFGFEPGAGVYTREDDNLVISFEDGGKIVLENYYAQEAGKAPSFIVEDTPFSAEQFLAQFNDESIMPAAGPAAGQAAATVMGSGGTYSDDAGNLIDGLSRLGGLGNNQWGRGTEVPEAFTGLVTADAAMGSAIPDTPTPPPGPTPPGPTPPPVGPETPDPLTPAPPTIKWSDLNTGRGDNNELFFNEAHLWNGTKRDADKLTKTAVFEIEIGDGDKLTNIDIGGVTYTITDGPDASGEYTLEHKGDDAAGGHGSLSDVELKYDSATGKYELSIKYTLADALTHEDGHAPHAVEDSDSDIFNISVYTEAYDSDEKIGDGGNNSTHLQIEIKDDAPIWKEDVSNTIEDGKCDGVLDAVWGADGPAIDGATFKESILETPSGLTSGDKEIFYRYVKGADGNDDHSKLQGYIKGDGDGTVIFTVTLHVDNDDILNITPAKGSYTVEMEPGQIIDLPSKTIELKCDNGISTGSGPHTEYYLQSGKGDSIVEKYPGDENCVATITGGIKDGSELNTSNSNNQGGLQPSQGSDFEKGSWVNFEFKEPQTDFALFVNLNNGGSRTFTGTYTVITSSGAIITGTFDTIDAGQNKTSEVFFKDLSSKLNGDTISSIHLDVEGDSSASITGAICTHVEITDDVHFKLPVEITDSDGDSDDGYICLTVNEGSSIPPVEPNSGGVEASLLAFGLGESDAMNDAIVTGVLSGGESGPERLHSEAAQRHQADSEDPHDKDGHGHQHGGAGLLHGESGPEHMDNASGANPHDQPQTQPQHPLADADNQNSPLAYSGSLHAHTGHLHELLSGELDHLPLDTSNLHDSLIGADNLSSSSFLPYIGDPQSPLHETDNLSSSPLTGAGNLNDPLADAGDLNDLDGLFSGMGELENLDDLLMSLGNLEHAHNHDTIPENDAPGEAVERDHAEGHGHQGHHDQGLHDQTVIAHNADNHGFDYDKLALLQQEIILSS